MKKWAYICLAVAIIFFSSISGFGAIPHAPHTADNNVSCLSCHNDSLPVTDRSAICSSSTCHGVGSPLELRTHSAAIIHEGEDPVTWPYGNWATECLDCHAPHMHFQLSHLSQLRDDLYLVTGTIDSINTDPLYSTTVANSSPDEDP